MHRITKESPFQKYNSVKKQKKCVNQQIIKDNIKGALKDTVYLSSAMCFHYTYML